IAEITTNLKKLQLAQITKKQAIYIYNHVILPRFQYRILFSYLNLSQLKQINQLISTIVRQKAKIARGPPNSKFGTHRQVNLRRMASPPTFTIPHPYLPNPMGNSQTQHKVLKTVKQL